MKRIFLSALIGVGLLTLILPLSGSEAARPPVDYPLVCRGGGDLKPGAAEGAGNLGFEFKRGTKPAGEELKEGSCSWTDRGMYEAEPNRISQHVEEVVGAPKPFWYEELRSSDKYWTFMVSNNGKGQLIATSARPGGAPTTITTFIPPAEGLRTFYVNHEWHNDRVNCENPFAFKLRVDDAPAGQVLVGYVNDYYAGSGPFPCEWNSKVDYRGTTWFDLSEIFDKPSLQIVEKATLKFKTVDGSVAAYDDQRRPITRVCEDRLSVANADSLKGFSERVSNYSGDIHFPASDPIATIKGCPPAGCSIDVTEVVNKWITGKIGYGFVIVGENEDWLDKLIPHDKSVCQTRYTDFSLTVSYRPGLLAAPPKTPGVPGPGGLSQSLDIRKNVALASNLATAKASSTSAPYSPAKAIDGEHRGLNWLSGGGWQGAGPTNNDWLQVDFKGRKTIDEIDVYMVQDNFASPVEPDVSMPTFTKYGLTNFRVQFLTQFGDWRDVPALGNPVIGNTNVLKRLTVPRGLFTQSIRIQVSDTPDKWCRITEVEAWGY